MGIPQWARYGASSETSGDGYGVDSVREARRAELGKEIAVEKLIQQSQYREAAKMLLGEVNVKNIQMTPSQKLQLAGACRQIRKEEGLSLRENDRLDSIISFLNH